MRYIQSQAELKQIVFLLIAVVLYSIIYFILDNRFLLKLYFGRRKSIVKLKGRGKELVETRARFVIQKSPVDKKVYHLLEIHDKVYHLSKAKIFGTIDYAPLRVSVLFNKAEIIGVALEDKKVYEELIDDFCNTFKRVFITSVGVILIWKILLLKMLETNLV